MSTVEVVSPFFILNLFTSKEATWVCDSSPPNNWRVWPSFVENIILSGGVTYVPFTSPILSEVFPSSSLCKPKAFTLLTYIPLELLKLAPFPSPEVDINKFPVMWTSLELVIYPFPGILDINQSSSSPLAFKAKSAKVAWLALTA